MIRILITALFTVSLANAQIIESPVDATTQVPAASVPTSTPVEQQDTLSNADAVIEETPPVVVATTEISKTSDALYKEGAAKKSKGTALTVFGGVCIGFASVYTILFISDNESFGIPLGGRSNGYSSVTFYLNPGIFGLPVGIPCLVSGIINSAKGRNMMEEAKRNGYQSSLKVQPYMYYSMKKNESGVGLVLSF
jgi:hypothetical protein